MVRATPLSRRLLFTLRRENWPWLGCAICLVAAAAAAVIAYVLERETVQIRAATHELQIATISEAPAKPAPDLNLAQLETIAPPGSRYFDDIRTFFDLAGRQHLQVSATEYQVDAGRYRGFVVHTMHVRTRDEYPALKAFLAAVLETIPHAALNDLRFDRSTQGSSAVDATLTLSLVYRRTPGEAESPASLGSSSAGAP